MFACFSTTPLRRVKTEPHDDVTDVSVSFPAERWQCPQCPEHFATEEELTQHYKPVHEGSVYSCDLCSETFIWKAELDAHVQEHSGEFRYRCPRCLQGFSRLLMLRRHAMSAHALMHVQRSECDTNLNPTLVERLLQREMGVLDDDKHTQMSHAESSPAEITADDVMDDEIEETKARIAQCPHCPRSYTNR